MILTKVGELLVWHIFLCKKNSVTEYEEEKKMVENIWHEKMGQGFKWSLKLIEDWMRTKALPWKLGNHDFIAELKQDCSKFH